MIVEKKKSSNFKLYESLVEHNSIPEEEIYSNQLPESQESFSSSTQQCLPEMSNSNFFNKLLTTSHSENEWSEKKTLLFIEERLQLHQLFHSNLSGHDKYWHKILNKLIAEGYKECSIKGVEGLKRKWNNLMITYRRNVDKLKKNTGDSSIKWPYFKRFHEVFESKKSVNPPKNHLLSTFSFEKHNFSNKIKKEKTKEDKIEEEKSEEEDTEDETIASPAKRKGSVVSDKKKNKK